jgi:hypothetical protein
MLYIENNNDFHHISHLKISIKYENWPMQVFLAGIEI